MSDEVVVFNDVNICTGKRCLFVKRAGQPVDLAKWFQWVPEAMRSYATFDQFEMGNGALQWHCLRMEWMPREVIGFELDFSHLQAMNFQPRILAQNNTVIPAVSWTVLKGERLSGAWRSAAELYWATFSVWPQLALVRALPKDAPEYLSLTPDPPLQGATQSPAGRGESLKIVEANWVWRGLVMVL